jgi:hypothetical protein
MRVAFKFPAMESGLRMDSTKQTSICSRPLDCMSWIGVCVGGAQDGNTCIEGHNGGIDISGSRMDHKCRTKRKFAAAKKKRKRLPAVLAVSRRRFPQWKYRRKCAWTSLRLIRYDRYLENCIFTWSCGSLLLK